VIENEGGRERRGKKTETRELTWLLFCHPAPSPLAQNGTCSKMEGRKGRDGGREGDDEKL